MLYEPGTLRKVACILRAVDRVVAILEEVARSPSACRPSDAARAIGLSVSTASRLMRELERAGVLSRSGDGVGYVMGERLVRLALARIGGSGLASGAIEKMEAIRDVTGESVSLHVRAGNERLCIAGVQSTQEVRRVVRVGVRLPLHVGVTGWVFMSALTDEERERYLGNVELGDTELQALRTHIEVAREAGWAAGTGAWKEGISAVATPLWTDSDAPTVLAVSGPSFRFDAEAMQSALPALLAGADAVRASAFEAYSMTPLPWPE